MVSIIQNLIGKKFIVNLLVGLLVLMGYTVLKNLNRESFPQVNFDMVSVKTIYPGGSPDELEQLVTFPIEKKLREVDGLDKVRAYNIENVSVVVVYIDPKATNKPSVVQDIKDAIDLIDDLPAKAEKPIVEEIKLDKTPVINVAIYPTKKGIGYKEVRETAKELEDFLYEIDGVAEVEDFGYLDREYIVQVNPKKLETNRIGINQIIGTLATRNLDFPGGSIKQGNKEFILRTKGQFKNTNDVKETVIRSNDLSFATKIKDVAKVQDTFEEADIIEQYNGKRAVVYKIWKKRSADEISLVDKIKESITKFKNPNAEKISLKLFNDASIKTRNDIETVVTNFTVGFFLLLAVMLLILGFRLAAIVAMSIPISFMMAFIGMGITGLTINVITLFGMIMVLGMIVDFSIVVSENSHRYMELGLNKNDAIKKGVGEVVWPMTVTLLCISAAFSPLLFLSGTLGKFVKGIPIVLMISLTASWFIALFAIPTYLKMFMKEEHPKLPEEDLEDAIEPGLFGYVQRAYQVLLKISLKFRYVTLGILIVMLVFALSFIPKLGFVFAPDGGATAFTIKIKMPQTVNLNTTKREANKINKIILKLPKKELKALHSRIGVEETGGLDPRPGDGTHKATFLIYLTEEVDRDRIGSDIMAKLKKDILAEQKKGKISKLMKFEFILAKNGPPIGKPVNVEIRGEDLDVMDKITKEYMSYLETIKGVRDISTDLEAGKKEYRYVVNEVIATRSEISVYDIATSLNASFEGAIATNVKIGDESIDVRVQFCDKYRRNVNNIKNVHIANKKGGLIPLNRVTKVIKTPGISQINRLNYKRIAQVQAELDTNIITAMEVNTKLREKFKDISKKYPDYDIKYGGEEEDTKDNLGDLGTLFMFALLIIYIILAIFFSSLILPIVIMSAIPFSMVGVIFALGTHGQPMSFMSTLGVFSLAGVIVSNTLVLVEFINNLRDEGKSLKQALISGGVMRLRPIFLTTATTVLGLIPSIYAFMGAKNYFVAPLALAFGYGLIFATFITLVLIPSLYHIGEDVKGLTSKILGKFGIKMGTTIYGDNE